MNRHALFATCLLLVACGDPHTPHTAASPAHFVGSSRCESCHATEAAAWRKSQHHIAMQSATAHSVLAPFAGEKISEAGVTTTFSRNDSQFVIRTRGSDGVLADFTVQDTIGVWPLQQYLLPLPRGRLQAFGYAWDSRPHAVGGQRWFNLHANDRSYFGTLPRWTGLDATSNFMCIDCHTTNLRKNYEAATRKYSTSWSELGVGCEACHGPGSNHVAWADLPEIKRRVIPNDGLAPSFKERSGVTWHRDPVTDEPVRSKPRETDVEIEVCARCHSRRSQLTDKNTAADSLHDGFRTSLLEPGLFYADGQMRDEVYNYGSFLQSRMYSAGVTCSDCHEPHSTALLAPGDAVCLRCHDAKRYATPRHHFHLPDSAGSHCVACHMPTRTYMVVDSRHDHSLRIPLPNMSAEVGAPDACTNCHRDRSQQWAAAEILKRYPHPKASYQTFASAFSRFDQGQTGAGAELVALANDATQPAIVRASAWQRLAAVPDRLNYPGIDAASRDPSPLVRRAAATAAGGLAPAVRVRLLSPLLSDPRLSVRLEAFEQLIDLPVTMLPAESLRRTQREFVAAQQFNADRPEAHVNLGHLYAARGRLEDAVQTLREGLTIDPSFAPIYVNLADIYRSAGDEVKAELVLRQGLKPTNASAVVCHALGLSLVRQHRLTEAIRWLGEATARAPNNQRFLYVYAVALHDSGARAKAIAVLEKALKRWPSSRAVSDVLTAYRNGS